MPDSPLHDDLADELARQASPHTVTANSEPDSWRVGDKGDVWLDHPISAKGTFTREGTIYAQRPSGTPHVVPLDTTTPDALSHAAAEALDILR